jgi:lysophospholipase L1-like esterase
MPQDSKYPGLHHKGRGGWHWQLYLEGYNVQTDKGAVSSPFVFGPRGRDNFDFARYIREKLGGETPEIITILLGANDVYGSAPLMTPEKIGEIIERARTIVGKIRAAAPESVIGVLTMLPCSDQTAFGKNYQNCTTEWQYRRAAQLYNAALIKNFDGRQNERIYLVPVNLGFETSNAFPTNPPNALHFKEEGYAPITLEIGAWITHLLETKAVTAK